MDYTFEINNARNDSTYTANQITERSPVVEVFSALADGRDVSSLRINGTAIKKAETYIKQTANRAANGDFTAMAELNTIRKIIIEPKLLQEIKLLSVLAPINLSDGMKLLEIETYNWLGLNLIFAEADVSFPYS